MSTVYDAIIVGGGIAGISVAYHLVCQGAKVLLFDRKDKGQATEAGAGVISPFTASTEIGFGSDALFHFASEALQYYPHLIEQLKETQNESSIYTERGTMIVAVSEDEQQELERVKSTICQRLEKRGLSTTENLHLLSATEAHNMFSALTETKGAVYCSRAAQVNGSLLSQALYRVAQQHGLTVKTCGVEQIILQNHTVKGVVANQERFSADTVTIAAGAWSQKIGAQVGLHIPVQPERGQIIHLHVSNIDTINKPVVSTLRGRYILSWPNNQVSVGATRESGVGLHPNTTVAGIHEILGEALRVTPGLSDASLQQIQVGLRPVTEDELPILGTVPDIDNLFLATGLGHTGLATGPYIGKVVAELILGQKSQMDLKAFDIQRFYVRS